MTADRAMLAPIAVYAWQVLGAGVTFKPVSGQRTSGLAWLITVGFIALVANAGTAVVNPVPLSVAGACLLAALVLFEWARRAIRGRFFSWIFSADTPEFLCTTGPYASIRNPFYTSYLLTMTSTVVIAPTVLRALVLSGMVIYFTAAARYEERKFEGSNIAEEYARYKARTGRFLPKLSAMRR